MNRQPRTTGEGATGAAGFTILELLVVLTVLAAAAALVMPNVLRRPVEPGLRATALSLAASLRAARMEAVRLNKPSHLIIDLDARRYWIEGSASRRAIAPSLAIAATLADSGRISTGAGRYAFYPDGSASGGAITLAGSAGSATIAVNWLTGATEVAWTP